MDLLLDHLQCRNPAGRVTGRPGQPRSPGPAATTRRRPSGGSSAPQARPAPVGRDTSAPTHRPTAPSSRVRPPPHEKIRLRESPPHHRPAGCRRLVEYHPDLPPTRRDKPGQEWTCSRFCSHLTSSTTSRKGNSPVKVYLVEVRRFELLTSSLRTKRSTN